MTGGKAIRDKVNRPPGVLYESRRLKKMTDKNTDIALVAAPHSPRSDDNTASDTSTLVYSQEVFETYQDRVKEIAQKTWPGIEKDRISVEGMHGGSYNRITGIEFQTSELEKPQHYILRNPRFPDLAPLTDQLAPLRFLYDYSKLPIPKMVAYDCTNDNALGKPYIIQERAPGNSIMYEYPICHIKADLQPHDN